MDFASSTRAAENMTKWKGIVANSSVVPQLWRRDCSISSFLSFRGERTPSEKTPCEKTKKRHAKRRKDEITP